MAKTRKTARKSGAAKKTTGAKKKQAAGAKKTSRKTSVRAPRATKVPKELSFGPLKKQIMDHVALLSRSKSSDQRVQGAIASLRRMHQELNDNCDPTMTLPLA